MIQHKNNERTENIHLPSMASKSIVIFGSLTPNISVNCWNWSRTRFISIFFFVWIKISTLFTDFGWCTPFGVANLVNVGAKVVMPSPWNVYNDDDDDDNDDNDNNDILLWSLGRVIVDIETLLAVLVPLLLVTVWFDVNELDNLVGDCRLVITTLASNASGYAAYERLSFSHFVWAALTLSSSLSVVKSWEKHCANNNKVNTVNAITLRWIWGRVLRRTNGVDRNENVSHKIFIWIWANCLSVTMTDTLHFDSVAVP